MRVSGAAQQSLASLLGANSSSSTLKNLLSAPARDTRADAVRISISDAAFHPRLEKHLSDCAKGQGNLSTDVALELKDKDAANNNSLTGGNMQAQKTYQAITSMLSYDKRARMIASVNDFTECMHGLKDGS